MVRVARRACDERSCFKGNHHMPSPNSRSSESRSRSRRASEEAGRDAPAPLTPPLDAFTEEECELIQALRESYERGLDLFSRQELSRLRFLSWLVDSGQLEP